MDTMWLVILVATNAHRRSQQISSPSLRERFTPDVREVRKETKRSETRKERKRKIGGKICEYI